MVAPVYDRFLVLVTCYTSDYLLISIFKILFVDLLSCLEEMAAVLVYYLEFHVLYLLKKFVGPLRNEFLDVCPFLKLKSHIKTYRLKLFLFSERFNNITQDASTEKGSF